jgi:hypothetical protein
MWYYWVAKWRGYGVAGISKKDGHLDVRGRCVTDLSLMISDQKDTFITGQTPLVSTSLIPWTAGE